MKTALRWAGRIALGFPALVALIAGAAFGLLHTDAGGKLARRMALPRVNAAIAGDLQVDRLRLRGERIVLERVTLRDPAGGVVARALRIEVAFNLLPLLHGRLDVLSAEIVRPELHVVQDAGGTNLARAIAPRHPASPATAAARANSNGDGGGPSLDIELGRLTVSAGTIDFRSVVPGARRHARLDDLGVEGSARYAGATFALDANVDVGFDGGQLVARIDTPCAGCTHVCVDALRLPAALLSGLLPGLALAPDITLTATAEATKTPKDATKDATKDVTTAGDIVTAQIQIAAGGASLEAQGEVDLGTLRAHGPGVTVRGRGIDLSRLLQRAPPSGLAFDLHVDGGGRALDALDGSLRLTVPPSRLDGHVLGPVRLTARAVRGRYELADLRAEIPGVTVTGHGTADTRDVDVHVRVEADDLGTLGRSLAPRHGPPPVALGGRGRLDVALVGPAAAPSLRIAGRFPSLRVDDRQAIGLTVTAIVPDVRRPDAADVDLAAPLVSLGAQALRGIKVTARASTTRLSLQASTTAPFPLTIAATARRESPRALVLESLSLRYPEATWALAHPARVRYGQGEAGAGLSVEGFLLRAGRQSIAADIVAGVVADSARGARRLRGTLVIAALDLGRLPRALVPPRLDLGGVLGVDARLAGTAADPQVTARVTLGGGRLRGYHDLGLDLDARYGGARAHGWLAARGLGTSLTATFDVPTSWPARDGRAATRLDVALARTDLAALTKALGAASGRPAPARLQGRAELAVHVDGAARAPALNVDVRAAGLAVDGQAVGAVRLSVTADGDRPSEARLAVTRASSEGTVHTQIAVKTPLSLRRMLRRPPDADELRRTPVELTGDVEHLPLALLASIARYPAKVGGALSTHFALSGTALDPRGSLTADVEGATTGRFPPTDARVELDVDRRSVELRTRVVRTNHALLALVARLGAGPAALRDLEALAGAPVAVRAVLGPLTMERLGLPPETDRDPPRALKGRLHVDLTVDGTLRAPRAALHADAGDVRLDKALLGAGKITVAYADRQATVDAQLATTNGGTLRAHAVTRADLGYPAVTRLDARLLPLDVGVQAQRFDLQGLSGAMPELRTVGGLLAAAATVRGTTADPRVSGKVEWSDGVLAITGLGEYKRIHLAVHGDEDNLTLDDLSVGSGNGRAHVTGSAKHVAGRGYQMIARADTSKFPIYKEGQPLAAVSIGAVVKGTVSPFFTKATVDVHDARIELSDAKRKDLQSLESPDDVVLVDGGKPLNRAQAEKLRALLATRLGKERLAEGDAEGADAAEAEVKAPTAPARKGIRISVNAPRRLWVTGKDAYLELGLTPGFRVSSSDQTRVYGQVIVRRGRIDVFGRRFDLKADSTLELDGPPDRPQLDVSAQYQNQNENVTVLWTAKGPLDHLTIAVSSPNRPDLTESQLYTLMITGHLQLGGGTSGSSSPSATAASFLGGVVAAQLQKTLSKKLPLDVLTIDAGDGDGLNGTQLEAGRYVTDRLYVGYVGRVGADPTRYQNRNAVHVEYQLTSRWGIDGEYGDVGTGSFDLLWKKNY